MFSISKEFHFSAGHHIEGLPEDHPCSRPHGHNYVVTLVLSSDMLDDIGMVVDYGELNDFKRWLDATVDHRVLNDVLMPDYPTTAEFLAYFFYENCKQWEWGDFVTSVLVKETEKTSAIYYPGGDE